eukprot:Gb_00335 [translate_table: standard]
MKCHMGIVQKNFVYAVDNEGRSALHISAMKGHMGIVQEIMLHSPDCLEVITNDGKTALHLAIENDKEEVVDYMLSTDFSQFIIDKPDGEGNTALHLATMKTLPRRSELGGTAADEKSGCTLESDSDENSCDGPPRKSDGTVSGFVKAAKSLAVVGGLIVTVSFEGILNLFTGIITNGQREITPQFDVFIWYDSLALITSLVGVVGLLSVASSRLNYLPLKVFIFQASVFLIFLSLAFALWACRKALDIVLPERKYNVLDAIFILTGIFLYLCVPILLVSVWPDLLIPIRRCLKPVCRFYRPKLIAARLKMACSSTFKHTFRHSFSNTSNTTF